MAKNVWLATADGDYSTATNWSLGHVPLASEIVIIPVGSPSITSGLNQSTIEIQSFFVEDAYGGTIGSAAEYLSINPTNVHFSGAGLAYINVNDATDINIYGTRSKDREFGAGLYLLGDTIEELNLYKGDVGLAVFSGETSSVETVNIRSENSQNPDTSLITGDGAGIDAWNQSGGFGLLNNIQQMTEVTVAGGTLTIIGTGNITSLNVNGGEVYPDSFGVILDSNLRGGLVNFERSTSTRTVTRVNVWPGGRLVSNPGRVTFTQGVLLQDPSYVMTALPSLASLPGIDLLASTQSLSV